MVTVFAYNSLEYFSLFLSFFSGLVSITSLGLVMHSVAH